MQPGLQALVSWVTSGYRSQPFWAATLEILLLWDPGPFWPLGIRGGLKAPHTPTLTNRACLTLSCSGLAPTLVVEVLEA